MSLKKFIKEIQAVAETDDIVKHSLAQVVNAAHARACALYQMLLQSGNDATQRL